MEWNPVGILGRRSSCGEDLVERGVEEVGGGGARGGEPGFQRVAPAHQLFHPRHDPLLFDEGWKWDEGGRGQIC